MSGDSSHLSNDAIRTSFAEAIRAGKVAGPASLLKFFNSTGFVELRMGSTATMAPQHGFIEPGVHEVRKCVWGVQVHDSPGFRRGGVKVSAS